MINAVWNFLDGVRKNRKSVRSKFVWERKRREKMRGRKIQEYEDFVWRMYMRSKSGYAMLGEISAVEKRYKNVQTRSAD